MKSMKKSLLQKLFSGCMFTLMGIVILIIHLCNFNLFGNKATGIFCGGILMALGIAFLIYYFVGKKMLQSEIEEEEKKLNEQ